MSLDAIRRVVEDRLGLDAESLGASVLGKAVEDRRKVIGMPDLPSYGDRLTRDPAEFQALAEHLVVPETWFYRGGGGLFDFLARRAGAVIAGGRAFRALCLPCSTGEEPYSVAVALTEAGLPAAGWGIDAVDVSERAVATAGRATYRDFAFRQSPAWLRERYFRATERGWELSPAVRERVRFRVGNVLETPPGAPRYDLVLCRNLLIYLTPNARRQAMENLTQQLVPDGWIGVGHAEPSALAGRPFRPVGPGEYVLFGRSPQPDIPPRSESPMVVPPVPPAPSPPKVSTPVVETPTRVEPPKVERPSLSRARQLADAGRLAEAVAECQGVLADAGPSVEAYLLLGLARQARGELGPAADAFRRALYLDPHHADALTHAMLLSEATGRLDQAAAFRSRLARPGTGDRS